MQKASKLINIGILVSIWKVEEAAKLFIKEAESNGLRLLQECEAIPCGYPNHTEACIYLTFEELNVS